MKEETILPMHISHQKTRQQIHEAFLRKKISQFKMNTDSMGYVSYSKTPNFTVKKSFYITCEFSRLVTFWHLNRESMHAEFLKGRAKVILIHLVKIQSVSFGIGDGASN